MTGIDAKRRRLSGGMVSVVDQAIFSGANFLISMILARWMSVDDYGVFSSLYSVVILINVAAQALVLEPVSIFWQYNLERRRAYVLEVVIVAVLSSLLFVAILALATLAFGRYLPTLESGMVALGIVVTPLVFFWLARQFAYADLRPWRAVTYSSIYAVTLVVACGVLKWKNLLTSDTAILALGFGSVAAMLPNLRQFIRLYHGHRPDFTLAGLRKSGMEFARYGAWSFPSNLGNWFCVNIFLITLPATASLRATAELKAFLNILLPYQQVLQGTALIVQPSLARLALLGDRVALVAARRRYLLLATSGGVLFALAFFLFSAPIYRIIYGHRYVPDPQVILWGLLLPLTLAPIAAMRTITRADQKPQLCFLAYIVAIVVVGPPAIWFGSIHGLMGAIVGMAALHAMVLVILTWLFFRNVSLKS